ncbi:Nn.00g100790.m01.CDS01 [Neocucurbitaria sp. VM-36]
MAQTPQQRQANMRFAKAQEKKMGKPEQTIKKREPQKSPISKIWISMFPLIPVWAKISPNNLAR